MKKLRSLTWHAHLLLGLVLLAGLGTLAWSALGQKRLEKWVGPLPGWLVNPTEASDQQVDPEKQQLAIQQGNELIRRARFQLLQREEGFTANVLQIVQTPEKSYRSTGRYLQGPNQKSRLETEINVEGMTGLSQQISSGQVIWSVQEFQNVKWFDPAQPRDVQTRNELFIHRVDLQRIKEYAQSVGVSPHDPRIAREMSGGLAGLLATLEVEMNFRVLKKVAIEQEQFWVLEGEWKTPLSERNFATNLGAQMMRGSSPDRVRLYLRQSDLLPVRYLCLKKSSGPKGWYAQLAMELTDIVSTSQWEGVSFSYQSPSEDHVPNDITHEYITRLKNTFEPDTTLLQ